RSKGYASGVGTCPIGSLSFYSILINVILPSRILFEIRVDDQFVGRYRNQVMFFTNRVIWMYSFDGFHQPFGPDQVKPTMSFKAQLDGPFVEHRIAEFLLCQAR